MRSELDLEQMIQMSSHPEKALRIVVSVPRLIDQEKNVLLQIMSAYQEYALGVYANLID